MAVMLVYCTTRFIGFHKWNDAPDALAHLRNVHRHEFHVKVKVKVSHNDRFVEFQHMRAHLDEYLTEAFVNTQETPYSFSCEMIAEKIAAHMIHQLNYEVITVDVSEDGENGATFLAV